MKTSTFSNSPNWLYASRFAQIVLRTALMFLTATLVASHQCSGQTPTSADNSAGLPPVRDQGAQKSSHAWALAYYCKTYQEGRVRGWDVSVPEHQFSPSFLYNQIPPFEEGTSFAELLPRLADQGCATLADFPYVETNRTTWPPYTAFRDAINYRIQSYVWLGYGLTPGIIANMKSVLAGGNLCVIEVPVFKPDPNTNGLFERLNSTNEFYTMPADEDVYWGANQALTVVGYDDRALAGSGAFKVVNSWGTGWGNQGFAWLSYEFIQAFASDIYTMQSRPNYQPTSFARFQFAHTWWGGFGDNDNVTITIGVGNEASPLWSKVILTNLYRDDGLSVDMAVDLTDAVAYLPPSPSNRWWFRMDDHALEDVGVLSLFQIEHNGTTYDAADVMPLTGPFFGGSLFAYLPAGEAASPNYYVNDGSTAADQYCTAIGDDANDGLTPATPKRSLQAVIDHYTLKAGDTVWIDAGLYALTNDVLLTQLDRGGSDRPIRFVGVVASNGEPLTIFDRGTNGGVCFNLNTGVRFIQLENFWLRGGNNGVTFDGSWDYGSGLTIKNTRVSNTGGDAIALYEAGDVDLVNCRIDQFGRYGIKVDDSSAVLNLSTIAASTNRIGAYVYWRGGYYDNGASLVCSNSILYASGAGAKCASLEGWLYGTLVPAHWSCLFATNGAAIGSAGTAGNLLLDPLFADAPNGDFHLKSTAGRWDPAANGSTGAFVNDVVDSPCIDAGDPSADVGLESVPNGRRVNIGAYGGTAYASKSDATRRTLELSAPVMGTTNRAGSVPIAWNHGGDGWQGSDTLRLEYSTNSGTTWLPVGAANALNVTDGAFLWNTLGLTPGTNFALRLTCNQNQAVSVTSGSFTVLQPVFYYVNDASTSNDVYCTAVGDDANDGLSSATPKATLQALFDTYDLEPGDTVFVDTGRYESSAGVHLDSADGGSTDAPMIIQGSLAGTVIRCTAAPSFDPRFDNAAFACTAPYVEFRNLTVVDSGLGLKLSSNSGGAVVRNCLFLRNQYGVELIGSPNGADVVNCTFVGNTNAVYAYYANSLKVRQCVFNIRDSASHGIFMLQGGLVYSDYNDFLTGDGGKVGYYSGDQATLADWQLDTGQDAHSLGADPLFVNSTLGDYHLQSTAGSWLGGTFSADGADSPCIDAGDPTMPVGAEPAPNGGRINLGAYGGTAQASKTTAGRVVTVVSPNGGEIWRGTNTITWLTTGQGWSNGDTLKLEYSGDGGTTWNPIVGASALAYTAGAFSWNTLPMPSGARYRVRVICNQDPATADISDGNFMIHNTGLDFYVNDASTSNDVYCTAVGDDGNDGLSPATPKATVQAILDAYDLEPGDTVLVDTGVYLLTNNILVSASDSGSADAYVRIVGSTNGSGSVFDRGNTNPGTACFELRNSDFVSLENVECKRGYDGVLVNEYNRSYRFVNLDLHGNSNWGLEAPNNLYNGQYARLYVWNCLVVSNSAGGIYTRSHLACFNSTIADNAPHQYGAQIGWPVGASITVRNCIIGAAGANGILFCAIGSGLSSDYNDFFTANGAVVSVTTPSLAAWRAAAGQDAHSLGADPLFVNSTLGDYHLQSTAGSWHSGAFSPDPANSPCIDAGDPTTPVGAEPAPNGARINLGAYGGTAQASKAATGRVVTVVSPNGGEIWRGANSITWLTTGQGWSNGDTLKLEYSGDGGTTWIPIVGAPALAYTAGAFSWNTLPMPSGARYRVRVICNQDPATADISDANFMIHNTGLDFYVNDASTSNDVYCTAVGDDGNDGLSAAAPKATVQAILSAYSLQPGDTVFVDTGTYLLTNNLTIAGDDSGSSAGYVTIQGSTNWNGTVLLRTGSAYGSAVMWLDDPADYICLRNLQLTGSGDGLYVSSHTRHYQVEDCAIYNNSGYGVRSPDDHYDYDTPTLLFRRDLIYSNAAGGISITTRAQATTVDHCTLYGNGGTAIAGATAVQGTVVSASGVGRSCIQSAVNSDWNLFCATNGALVSPGVQTLWAWQLATGRDLHSLSADPLLADPVRGDFHLQSTGGRWNPVSGSFVTDMVDSPAIDAGNPAESVGAELSPNGNRINLGAYGGTVEASKSSANRTLVLIQPNGGENWRGMRTIRWLAAGQGWQPSDTVTVAYSLDAGTNWTAIPDGTSLRALAGTLDWLVSRLPAGTNYLIRITCDQDAQIEATSAAQFTLLGGGIYYVNDAVSTNDVYTTAAGNDANDGLTPATPKATMQSVLSGYDLESGDVVLVDAGTYDLTNNIVIGSMNGGFAVAPVHIFGVKGKTILDRGAPNSSGTSCLLIAAPYVSIENITCRNAYYGIQVNANNCSLLNNTVSGCGYHGILVSSAANAVLANNVVLHSGAGAAINLAAPYYGEGDFGGLPCSIINNTVVTTDADGIYTSAYGGPQLKNNIVQVSGSGYYCISARYPTGFSSLDYNDLYPQNGAQIGRIYRPNAYDANAPDLFTWRALTSWDVHSLSVDPLFADSANGDFHLKSAAGRYDPSAGKPPTDATAWVTDSVTSLAIDAGDPADAVADESLPNGGRINLGAFGGTGEASRSSSATRIVNVLSPNGGEVWSGFEAIELRTAGSGLQTGDTLRVEYSGDGGTTWQTLPGGNNVPAAQTRFWWDTRSVTNGSHYLVHATVLQDTSAQDVSDQMFRIANLVAPLILAQPQSQSVPVGSNVTFSVTVNDTISLSYQWRRNGSNIVGATDATITLNSVTFNAAGDYTVLVANPAGFVLSAPATLVVLGPPIIATQPASQTAAFGDNVNFTVTANGTQPLAYFWRKDGANLLGAPNDRTLTLGNVTTNDAGGYSVLITNVAGSVTSSVATLMIVVRPPNDNFTKRIVITGLVSTVTGSNVNASMESGEPFHYASTGGKSVWWTWTAPASGPVVMDTIGSSFDTIMAVYTDPTLPTNIVNRIASDDDSGGNSRSRVSFNAVAGVAYQIAVDGYNGSSGNITLNVRLNIPTLGMSSRLANGTFQFQLAGLVGSNYVLQASTDLTTWTPIATNVIPAAGFIPIADAGATNYTQRFYRAVLP